MENFEFEARCKDGSKIWVSNSTRAVFDEAGGISRYEGIAVDVTDLKLARQKLKNEHRLNQILIDALPCAAMLIRFPEHEIVLSNRMAREAGAAPGTKCYSAWMKRDEPCPWCRTMDSMDRMESRSAELETDGTVFDVHWVPIKPDLYLHYAFDITEKKRVEKQLQQAQKMEAIGTLAGGIAHDFNNILSAVLGYTELAMERTAQDSNLRSDLQEILSAGIRARDLVKQILAFSRESEQDERPISMAPIVKEALKLLRASLPATIEIRQKIINDLDNVSADPTRIRPGLPAILCTGYGDRASAKSVAELGVAAVVMKPAVKRELAKTLREVLDGGTEAV